MTDASRDCPECNGQGWVPVVVMRESCCGRSDWECGGRGCTGPEPEEDWDREQCTVCQATGRVHAKPETESSHDHT